MALVDVLSLSILDHTGDVKSLPLYIASGNTIVQLQAIADAIMTDLDPTINGQIVSCSVTVALVPLVTAKGAPEAGNTVHEGALLTYTADDTTYRHSVYIPSFEEAGFADNNVLETGIYATLQAEVINTDDKAGNDLASYVGGKRTFRK